MPVATAVVAALCFAAGGVLMKNAAGMTRALPTVGFMLLFIAGATCQALAMKGASMGTVYVAVLGLEAVLALLLSRFFLGETITGTQYLAAVLVIAGTALLRLR